MPPGILAAGRKVVLTERALTAGLSCPWLVKHLHWLHFSQWGHLLGCWLQVEGREAPAALLHERRVLHAECTLWS